MDGLTPEMLEEAHQRDLKVQEKHGVKLHTYWYNEKEGSVFCLAEAPNKEAFDAVHQEANGMSANEIIEVKEGH